jgi:hypothetical protein
MSTGTGTAYMEKHNRKSSMTMADLEAIHEHDKCVSNKPTFTSTKHSEHSAIFEDLCHEAEQDDDDDIHSYGASQLSTKSSHRGSLIGCVDDMDLPSVAVVGQEEFRKLQLQLYQRRHSSYEPRSRSAHRAQHQELKEHLVTLEDKHHLRRSSFVNNLLEFNLSVDVSMSDMGADVASPALHLSCPVLSYMNDDEEDSIELRMVQRPSLVSVIEQEEYQESWESLKDCSTEHPQDELKEYVIELPPMEEPKNIFPKRRRHSYKVLEEKLSEGSPLDVLKAWNSMGGIAALAMPAVPPPQPRSFEKNEIFSFETTRESPVETRAQVARGA